MPIATKTSSRAKFKHERMKSPRAFDPRSFRTKRAGASRIIIGCPKGKYSPSTGRCKVGTRAQAILRPKGNPLGPISVYINRIRNLSKREYAKKYYDYLVGKRKTNPDYPGISYMAAQSVRMQLSELMGISKNPNSTPGLEKSKGHIGWIGDYEYFTDSKGNLYQAHKSGYIDIYGYRSTRRWEAYPWFAKQRFKFLKDQYKEYQQKFGNNPGATSISWQTWADKQEKQMRKDIDHFIEQGMNKKQVVELVLGGSTIGKPYKDRIRKDYGVNPGGKRNPVSLKAWLPGRKTPKVITASQYGKAFDIASEIGAIRAVDGTGEVYRKIGGEWAGMPTSKKHSNPRKKWYYGPSVTHRGKVLVFPSSKTPTQGTHGRRVKYAVGPFKTSEEAGKKARYAKMT